MARNDEDVRKLRDWSERNIIRGSHDYVLDRTETVVAATAISYKTGGGSGGEICGIVIDKKSGAGGKIEVFGTPAIKTGPDEEAGYAYIPISPGQDCWTWGSAAVLYVKYQ